MTLLDYLQNNYPNGMDYIEAVNMCMGFYVSLNCIPKEVSEECNIDQLAITFSKLAELNLIHNYQTYKAVEFGANYHNLNDKGHWVEILSSILKKKSRN